MSKKLTESLEYIIKLATQELCCYGGGEQERINAIRSIRKVAQSAVIGFENNKAPDLYDLYERAGHKVIVDANGDAMEKHQMQI